MPKGARMGGVAQQAIELILARQLASGLAVPVLLVDASGDTLFFNEPAELIFGRRLDEIDALPFDRRTALLAPLSMDGEPIHPEEMPAMVAMRNRRPAHAVLRIHGLDGVQRPVEATAIPLESTGGRVLGAIVVLWAQRDPSEPPGAAG